MAQVRIIEVDKRPYRTFSSAGRSDQQKAGGGNDDRDSGEGGSPQRGDKQHVIGLQIDSAALGCIIGKGGANLARIQRETGASVNIARKGRHAQDNITVSGSTEESAKAAVDAIKESFEEALASNRLPVNHFVCIPLNTLAIQTGFLELKQKILQLEDAAAAKIDDSIFIDEKKIHLTVLVLKLYSEKSRTLAAQVLELAGAWARGALGKSALEVTLRGLQTMKNRTTNADVLYVDVERKNSPSGSSLPGDDSYIQSTGARGGIKDLQGEEEGSNVSDAPVSLQDICAGVVNAFKDSGLLLPKDARDPLLHMTVMNTKYRDSVSEAGSSNASEDLSQQAEGPNKRQQRSRYPKRVHFDASSTLEKFRSTSLGTVVLDRLELSEMSSVDASGFYHCLARTSLHVSEA